MFFRIKVQLLIYLGAINKNYHHQEVRQCFISTLVYSYNFFVLFVMRLDRSLSLENRTRLNITLKSSGLTLVPFSPCRPSGPLVPAGPWQKTDNNALRDNI